jgi:FkbM family methyltransferase
MSTDYFILTKPSDPTISVGDDDENETIIFESKVCYILPRNLREDYVRDGLFEKHLIEWCKQFCNPEKNMLDIGAHTGTYSLSLCDCFKNVYSFEPQRMTYYALCGSVVLSNKSNIHCFNIGLGSPEQCGTKNLNIISNDGGGSSIHETHGINILKKEEIIINTLDNINISDIGFIKMDIEDNEYFAILGGLETLKRCSYPTILFEYNEPFEKNSLLFDFLIDLGYKIVAVRGTNNMYLASFATKTTPF